jgi:hypothetical protein
MRGAFAGATGAETTGADAAGRVSSALVVDDDVSATANRNKAGLRIGSRQT